MLQVKRNKTLKTLVLFVFLGFFVPSAGFALKGSDKAVDPNKDKHVEVTADRMRSENGGQKIVFSGNVVSYWGDLKITSNILEIYNSEDKQETDEIVAIGDVFITRGTTRARGDRAVYLDKLQKVILTGVPKATAWQGKDIIEGREMIFLLDKDRFVVNNRVRMKIFPKGKKEEPDKKKSRLARKSRNSLKNNK